MPSIVWIALPHHQKQHKAQGRRAADFWRLDVTELPPICYSIVNSQLQQAHVEKWQPMWDAEGWIAEKFLRVSDLDSVIAGSGRSQAGHWGYPSTQGGWGQIVGAAVLGEATPNLGPLCWELPEHRFWQRVTH